jgi:quercetin dioxygenase-like cupin family protein
MNSSSLRTTFPTTALMLLAVFVFQTRSPQSSSATTSQTVARPLLLEKDEGERRIWREPPPGDFILKVSPRNNGSQHLVMGTEDMHPGDEFPMHKHLGQDEILYIVKGTVHAHVGDQQRDVHAGGTVFIPALTWVNVKNAGTDTASVVFVFSAPGFENYSRGHRGDGLLHCANDHVRRALLLFRHQPRSSTNPAPQRHEASEERLDHPAVAGGVSI